MSRRLEVELTSKREDGTYTWRAAGAKQPKGELDGALLYEGAEVGDVVRADAEFAVDGVYIVGDLKRVFGGITAAAHDGYMCAAGIVHELAQENDDSPQ